MSELEQLQQTLLSFLSNLSADRRAKAMRQIARELRESNRKRIQAQKNPDGSSFSPRKNKKRDKNGRVKRKMFSKLRTNKYMLAKNDANSAEILFGRGAENIARVHHFGLRDKVTRRIIVQYEKRELLGVTDLEKDQMVDTFLEHLSNP